MAILGWRVKGSQDTKIATLQSNLDRQLHVHTLAFDKEFEILATLWKALVELKLSTPNLLHLNPLSDSAVKQEFLDEWNRKNNALYDEVEKNRPFYAKEIYRVLRDIISLTTGATSFFRNRNFLDLPSAKETAEDLIALNQLVDGVCEEIRKRVFLA